MVTLTVVSIDAWRDPETGWYWNDQRRCGTIDIDPQWSTRKLLRAFREAGYLATSSAGKCTVDVAGSDPDTIEIQDRRTREPLFAVSFSYEGDSIVDCFL